MREVKGKDAQMSLWMTGERVRVLVGTKVRGDRSSIGSWSLIRPPKALGTRLAGFGPDLGNDGCCSKLPPSSLPS